jgi:hypothetical protein
MAAVSVTWILTWHDRLASRMQRQPWGLVTNLVIVGIVTADATVLNQLGYEFVAGMTAAFALGSVGLFAFPIWGGSVAELKAEAGEASLTLSSGGIRSVIPWTQLTHTELRDYVMLCRDGRCVALVPKRAFDPSGLAEFMALVESNTDEEWPAPVDPRQVVVTAILLVGLVALIVDR